MVCVADYYFGKYIRQQQNEQGKHKHLEKITRLEVFHNHLISVPCSSFSMKLYQQLFYERSIIQSLCYAYQFSFILTLQFITITKLALKDRLRGTGKLSIYHWEYWLRDRDDIKPNRCYQIERQCKTLATFDQRANGIIHWIKFTIQGTTFSSTYPMNSSVLSIG